MGGVRRENAPSFSAYYRGEYSQETLDDEQLRIERLMFGLRTDGIVVSDVGDRAALGRFLADGTLLHVE
jgi:hypothetical protein